MSNNQPNILFLMSDQHNYRTLSHVESSQGGEPVNTPTLDRLAQNGTKFEQAYCQVPLCGPSRISMLTGREPSVSGGWKNGSVLNPNLPTIPEVFSNEGYNTCLVGKMHLGGDRQFVGFDHRPYGDLTGEGGHQYEPLLSGSYNSKALNLWKGAGKDTSTITFDSRWRSSYVKNVGVTEFPESSLQEQIVISETVSFLREHQFQNPDQPWLLCASFSRPHPPYTAPQRHFNRYWPEKVTKPEVNDREDHPFSNSIAEWFNMEDLSEDDVMKARAAYFACVDYLDEIIGDLINNLEQDGFLDNTIIIYASDHGDMLGEHGLWGKRTWHEESSRVPLMIQLPEHRTGELNSSKISTPVSLVDLFPTLCGLAEIPKPAELDGEDLSEEIHSHKEPDRGPVFIDFFTSRFGEEKNYRVIRDEQYKYIGFSDIPDLLFNIENDPFEQHNCLSNSSDLEDSVVRKYQNLLKDSIDFDHIEDKKRKANKVDENNTLQIPTGYGNVYHMPDGRLIDADAQLYQPAVLAKDIKNILDFEE